MSPHTPSLTLQKHFLKNSHMWKGWWDSSQNWSICLWCMWPWVWLPSILNVIPYLSTLGTSNGHSGLWTPLGRYIFFLMYKRTGCCRDGVVTSIRNFYEEDILFWEGAVIRAYFWLYIQGSLLASSENYIWELNLWPCSRQAHYLLYYHSGWICNRHIILLAGIFPTAFDFWLYD